MKHGFSLIYLNNLMQTIKACMFTMFEVYANIRLKIFISLNNTWSSRMPQTKQCNYGLVIILKLEIQ